MTTTATTTTRVAVIGPNLYDQSKGTFHVHTAECKDGKNGRKYPLAYRHELEVSSRLDVAEWMYEDHLSDYGYEVGSEEADEYFQSELGDFYFHNCVKGLR